MRYNVDLSYLIAYNLTEVIIMSEEAHTISEKPLEKLLLAAYDHAFDEFYSGEKLDKLMETLQDDLYQIISLSYLTGYRAAGGSLPPHP